MKESISMDSRSGLHEDAAKTPNSFAKEREERLLRAVDFLRAEQVRGSAVTGAEADRAVFGRWRRVGLLGAAVVAVMAGAAVLLRGPGPPRVHQDAPPDSAIGTALVQPAPQPAPPGQPAVPNEVLSPEGVPEAGAKTTMLEHPAPIPVNPGAPLPGDPDPSGPALAEHSVVDSPNTATAAMPAAAATTPSEAIEPVAPEHDAGAAASLPPAALTPAGAATPPEAVEPVVPGHDAVAAATLAQAGAADADPESATAKPVLWLYYAFGSSVAEQNAHAVAARIGENITSADFKAQTDSPKDAVIRFSEERNHTLARAIGKSLGDSGYRWRIESSASSAGPRRNIVEVWLPAK
jgi:hypothetical protein